MKNDLGTIFEIKNVIAEQKSLISQKKWICAARPGTNLALSLPPSKVGQFSHGLLWFPRNSIPPDPEDSFCFRRCFGIDSGDNQC